MKVGVLSFAHVHAAGYAALLRDMDGVEVVTSDPEAGSAPPGEVRGEVLARRLGVEHVATYQELFDQGPDAVIVAAENARHRALVELAAKHGVDVLCEKPLATTEEDGEAMVAACRDAGVRLGVAYPVRFSPAYAALRDAVRGGATGPVLTVAGANNGRLPADSRAWFTDPGLAGGGALMDHTVHIADLLDDLFGEARAEEVYAQTNNLMYEADGVAVETAGLVTVRYTNGAVATIDCSWSHPDHHPTWGGLELQLVGERATVEMDAFCQVVSGFDERQRTGVLLPWGSDLDGAMVRAFLYGTEAGEVDGDGPAVPDAVQVADGEAGLRSLRIALAGYASARSGRPVRLGDRTG
ncbi:dehydrogenase [Streptomyces abyssalis]|uniref:Dehydrogenase n=1 Tax=Streptomyces abyssalis TaxID=933944 RepID=A0A1E7JQ78_9ACTN|nr:Gfo/Idh/MocA family oxidoreductase [Streptomyces abyssalis]OEU90395.1 dehydrogenase [Streptomyces abyssalis]OEU95132.1 dehydrogenase [Streptomyces abyssalis]